MEKFSLINKFEQRKQILRDLIEEKKKESLLDNDEYDEITQNIENYKNLTDEIGGDNLLDFEKNNYRRAKERLASATIHVETLPELRFVMEQLIDSEEKVVEMLAHENAHANIAATIGAKHDGYSVVLLNNGGIYETKVLFPGHLSLDKIDSLSKQILRAPEMYDKKVSMSDYDKQELQRIKNKEANDSSMEIKPFDEVSHWKKIEENKNPPKGWDRIN